MRRAPSLSSLVAPCRLKPPAIRDGSSRHRQEGQRMALDVPVADADLRRDRAPRDRARSSCSTGSSRPIAPGLRPRRWESEGPGADRDRARHASVPHISARPTHDVFFGLGFVHAQDRLWQMTLMRRTAQGRLSELFGERTLEIDELMRALDLYGAGRSPVAAQDDDTKAALEAYSARGERLARGRASARRWGAARRSSSCSRPRSRPGRRPTASHRRS